MSSVKAPVCPKCNAYMDLVISAKIIESEGCIVVAQSSISDHDLNCKQCGTNIKLEHLEKETMALFKDFVTSKLSAVNGMQAFIISEVVDG